MKYSKNLFLIPILLLQILSGTLLFSFSESSEGIKLLKYNTFWSTGCCNTSEESKSCCAGETTCESSCLETCCTVQQLFSYQNFEKKQVEVRAQSKISKKIVNLHTPFYKIPATLGSPRISYVAPKSIPTRAQSYRAYRCVWNC